MKKTAIIIFALVAISILILEFSKKPAAIDTLYKADNLTDSVLVVDYAAIE